MYSELFVFVLCLALGQSNSVQDANVHGLSAKDAQVYYKIMNMHDATYEAKFQTFDHVFKILHKLAIDYTYGLTSEDEDASTQLTQALSKAHNATNFLVEAISLALGGNCADLPVENTSHLEEIFSYIGDAIDLAKRGNYSANAADIENNRNLVLATFDGLVNALYDSMRTCLNTNDDDSLTAIQTAQEESAQGLHYTTNAIFNTIKHLAYVFTTKTEGGPLLSAVMEKWENALIGLRIDIQTEYSLIIAMFVKTQLKVQESLSALLSIQNTQVVAAGKYKKAAAAIFDSIIKDLVAARLGNPYDGEDDYSALDEAQAQTAAKFRAGLRVLVQSVKTINPKASDAAEEIWLELRTFSNKVANVYYSGVRAARDKDTSKTVAETTVNQLRRNSVTNMSSFINKIVQISTLGYNLESRTVETIRQRLVQKVSGFANNIFDAIDVLLKATHDSKRVNIGDLISSVENYRSNANSQIHVFTLLVETLRVKALRSAKSN